MILTLDIGNTNIKVALFENHIIQNYWRISSHNSYSCDELAVILLNFFKTANVKKESINGIVISSVVPSINFTIEHMCSIYFNMKPLWINPGIKTGIDIKYDIPHQLGSDRICNAVAAYSIYGGPCIYIDFGTATTFGALNEKGVFLGGCICPGIKVSGEALVSGTAKLSRFEYVKPESIICKNTVSNLQAGLIYGYIGQVSYIIDMFKKEMNNDDVKVIGTGGMAKIIIDDVKNIDIYDGSLTLKGLDILYHKNK